MIFMKRSIFTFYTTCPLQNVKVQENLKHLTKHQQKWLEKKHKKTKKQKTNFAKGQVWSLFPSKILCFWKLNSYGTMRTGRNQNSSLQLLHTFFFMFSRNMLIEIHTSKDVNQVILLNCWRKSLLYIIQGKIKSKRNVYLEIC